ncbi:hypothetical protein BV20DRAFT_958380 [Pilatotrama ljubarskyi]|nr:hypothetical protein BV20DRAFT_958380 [Pilatotrama ljubarskyi]
MPSVRAALDCPKPLLKNVKGIVYRRPSDKGVPVNVPTAIHPVRDCLAVPRFPSFEAILGLDAELHETWVSCPDALGRPCRFLVAAQYHPGHEDNRALKRILPEIAWKGDLVVMRGGTAYFIVNMGDATHRELAERAVRKFLLETAPIVAHAAEHNIPLLIPTAM